MLFHPADYERTAIHTQETMNGLMSKVMAKRALEVVKRSKDVLTTYFREQHDEDIYTKISEMETQNDYDMVTVYNTVLQPLIGMDLDQYMRKAST